MGKHKSASSVGNQTMFSSWLFGSPTNDFLEAARDGKYDLVREMLAHAAASLVVAEHRWDSKTALHLACFGDHLEVAQLLLKSGANVAAVDWFKRTPLHDACMKSDSSLKMVRLLLDNGADTETKDNDGWTPLHFACEKLNLEIIRLLLQRKANIDAQKLNWRNSIVLCIEPWLRRASSAVYRSQSRH